MTEILQNVINGDLSVDQLIQQLEELDLSVANGGVSHQFVSYFLNYIRESCSWVFDNQFAVSSACSHNENSQILSETTAFLEEQASTKGLAERIRVKENTPNAVKTQAVIHKNGIIETISLGCTSYIKANKKKKKRINFKTSVSDSSTITPPDITDLDTFPPIGSSNQSSKAVRRIKPTPLTCDPSVSQSFSEPSNNFSNVFEASPFQEQGTFLMNERLLLKENQEIFHKISTPAVPSLNVQRSTVISSNVNPPEVASPVVPELSLVTEKEVIEIFSKIYNALLNNGLVPNMMSEFYFLFQLLTANVKVPESSCDPQTCFNTIHNCVYFIVSILNQQHCFLSLLDNRTLKSLIDIPFLKSFSSTLVQHLVNCMEKNKIVQKKPASTISEVAYRADTDTRQNFPTNQSFTSFSKQRDLFYEILYAWQNNSGLNDAHFERWFTRSCHNLIDMGSENVNCFHLAKLIRSQILISCLNSESMTKLPEFYQNDNAHDKLAKLHDRLLAPKGNPCPLPDFPGMQGFFESFLKVTSSSVLNAHLASILKHQLLETNNSDFFAEMESCSTEELRERFSCILHELRVLSKFLGYITFMPYKSSKSLPQHMLEEMTECRKDTQLELNCAEILETAAVKGHLVLTVPWIIEYLSMIDQIGMSLEQVKQAYKVLVKIHRGHWQKNMIDANLCFLRLVIGWWFENQCVSVVHDDLSEAISERNKLVHRKCLDMQNVVDVTLINSCCPYLQELKNVLEDFIKCVPKTAKVRKITPFSVTHMNEVSSEDKKLESALEEYFFFLQPTAMKKTVDFIAERIACNFIHKINLQLEALKVKYSKEICKDIAAFETKPDSKKIQSICIIQSEKLCHEAKRWASDLILKQCFIFVKSTFSTLLSDQFDAGVVLNACKISTRLALERLSVWIEANITLENVKNDVRNKVVKAQKKQQQITWDLDNLPVEGDWDSGSPTECLKSLRNYILLIRSCPQSFQPDNFLPLCKEITDALEQRHFHNFVKIIISLTVNIIVSVIVHLPDDCTAELISAIIKLWEKCPPKSICARHVLCPLNLLYLQHSKSNTLSQKKMILLLESMLQSNLISQLEINEQMSKLVNSKMPNVETNIKFFVENFNTVPSNENRTI